MRRLFAWLCAGLLTFAPALANATCPASPAFGTGASTNSTTNGSTTLSSSATNVVVTANDIVLIIFEIGAAGGGAPASTLVTDHLGLSYTKRGSTTTWLCASGVTCTHEIWWAFAGATTGTDYALVTVGAGTAGSVYSTGIVRFTGVASGSTPFDANAQEPNISTNGTASTTQPTVTLTTNTAHDLLLSFCDGAGGGSSSTNCHTAASGWSSALTGIFGGSGAWGLYYKSVTATQSSASYNVGSGVQNWWVDRGDALAGVDSCGVNGSLMMLDVGT